MVDWVVQTNLISWWIVEVAMIFDKDNYTVFSWPGMYSMTSGAAHDHIRQCWGISYHIKKYSLSVPGLLLGWFPPNKSRGNLNSLVYNPQLCLWCNRKYEYTRWGPGFYPSFPDSYKYKWGVKSLPKIAKFIDHYTSGLISLFVHLDNHLYITGSLHQSLTGWYVLHYCFHFSYRIIWLFRSWSGINYWTILDTHFVCFSQGKVFCGCRLALAID